MNPLTTPHITANSFLTATSTSSTGDDPEPTLIYLVPGNPGLISYYHTYLSLLSSNLSSSANGIGSSGSGSTNSSIKDNMPQCIIHGKSMGGFEIMKNEEYLGSSGSSINTTNMRSKRKEGMDEDDDDEEEETNPRLYSLSEQIEHVERNIHNFVDAWYAKREHYDGHQEEQQGGRGIKLILIGHSVGAYIVMEILRRHKQKKEPSATVGGGDTMDIIGGILLFPTVVDIAKSPSGRKLRKLLYIPYLAFLTSLLVKFLVFILPEPWLRRVVGMALGSPPGNAIDNTVEFLKSRRGVEQAIHMAADEMREITSDKWSDEIWGITSNASTATPTAASTTTLTLAKGPLNLMLYFAQQDHWVANQTRDEIIRARGGIENSTGTNGPRMQVCEDGVEHGFCIRHSDIMAKKTAGWVKNIIQGR
ncbi:hypothetical protein ACJ72_02508 [Emergomyces africanus]|uniref:AB hydrolase-1 domain-containing protein n=1 Tax=Emergomyces africanus TaxID=1955775 RepID=A0A1B7P274_9EURO|nr:hypothetical protein ACJ72_02508 [Emergomyces africanus]